MVEEEESSERKMDSQADGNGVFLQDFEEMGSPENLTKWDCEAKSSAWAKLSEEKICDENMNRRSMLWGFIFEELCIISMLNILISFKWGKREE